MTIEPELTALMCDGMGWFRALDFKRALLVYDRIQYLVPRNLTEFEDVDGERRFMVFPDWIRNRSSFSTVHFDLNAEARSLLEAACQTDLATPEFVEALQSIPQQDQLYTWRVANADAGLGGGQSRGLVPGETARAQSLLLNNFLLAADAMGHVPITGKPYIHQLIGAKYARARSVLRQAQPRTSSPLRADVAGKLDAVSFRLLEAFVSDEELGSKTEEQILEYKERNRNLFRDFSAELLELTAAIGSIPGTEDFEASVRHALQTTVWKKQAEIRADLKGAWQAFFKTGVKVGVSALIGIGVAPLLPVGALVVTAASAAGAWLVPDLFETLASFRKARNHGLYYLMGFGESVVR
jgi:hypothetical protein